MFGGFFWGGSQTQLRDNPVREVVLAREATCEKYDIHRAVQECGTIIITSYFIDSQHCLCQNTWNVTMLLLPRDLYLDITITNAKPRCSREEKHEVLTFPV